MTTTNKYLEKIAEQEYLEHIGGGEKFLRAAGRGWLTGQVGAIAGGLAGGLVSKGHPGAVVGGTVAGGVGGWAHGITKSLSNTKANNAAVRAQNAKKD